MKWVLLVIGNLLHVCADEETILRFGVFDCVQALFEANHAMPSRTVTGWFALGAFKHSCGKRTKADHHGTLCTRLGRNTLHTNEARFRLYTSKRSSWHGAIRFWHARDHIGKWSTVARFQIGSARVRFALGASSAPLMRHGYGTLHESAWTLWEVLPHEVFTYTCYVFLASSLRSFVTSSGSLREYDYPLFWVARTHILPHLKIGANWGH